MNISNLLDFEVCTPSKCELHKYGMYSIMNIKPQGFLPVLLDFLQQLLLRCLEVTQQGCVCFICPFCRIVHLNNSTLVKLAVCF